MTNDPVSIAYAARAAEYIDAVGSIDHADERDVAHIREWAIGIDGRIVDVGCGPGQWTDYLRRAGAEIEVIEGAKRRYPASTYRVGRAEELGVGDASLGGILAWFSLIHTEPDLIGESLSEFGRCLRSKGSLLIGFVDGPARQAFDHRVVTAYS